MQMALLKVDPESEDQDRQWETLGRKTDIHNSNTPIKIDITFSIGKNVLFKMSYL